MKATRTTTENEMATALTKKCQTCQMVAVITDAIIEGANVAIPCGRPKRMAAKVQATTVLVRRL